MRTSEMHYYSLARRTRSANNNNSSRRKNINNYCKKEKIPLIHGAVTDWQGYITVFQYKQEFGLDDLFDFTEYFNSIFPLTPTLINVTTFSAGDVSLDDDTNEGLGEEGFNPNIPVTKFANILNHTS